MASPGSGVGDESQMQEELDEAVTTLNATCANPVTTPSPTRDGEVDGIAEHECASNRAPFRPTVSPASNPDVMPVAADGDRDQVPDRVPVIAEGSVSSVQDAVADVPSSHQPDVAMEDRAADQPSDVGSPVSAQADAAVQDLGQVTVVVPQLGRVLSPSTTVLFGGERLVLQLRDTPLDPTTWTALEWVIRARPSYITADEFITPMVMRPRSKAEHEARRRAMPDEVLSFDVRTLVVWVRAYSLEEHFVDVLHRPQRLLNDGGFSPEPADLRLDLQMARRSFAAREAHRVNHQVGDLASRILQRDVPILV